MESADLPSRDLPSRIYTKAEKINQCEFRSICNQSGNRWDSFPQHTFWCCQTRCCMFDKLNRTPLMWLWQLGQSHFIATWRVRCRAFTARVPPNHQEAVYLRQTHFDNNPHLHYVISGLPKEGCHRGPLCLYCNVNASHLPQPRFKAAQRASTRK